MSMRERRNDTYRMQPTPTDSLPYFKVRHSIPYSLNKANTFVTEAASFLFGMNVSRA
jgi:hypothetical protein